MNLTKEYLESKGFKHSKASGPSGQDSWAGMDFWDKGDITLRGNIKYPLKLAGYFNSRISTEEELEFLLKILV